MQKEELRRMPLALQQNSFSSMSERQWQADLDEQHDGWSCSERRVIAAMEDYLEKCIRGSCGLPEIHPEACEMKSRRFKRALCVKSWGSKGGWTAFRMGVGHSWKERFSPFLSDVHRLFQATDALTLV